MTSADDFVAGDLKVKMIDSGSIVQLVLVGEISSREPQRELSPYFEQVLAKSKAKRLVLDFSQLSFMNSSALKPVLDVVNDANNQNRQIELRYNKEVQWQRTSHACMGVLFKQMPSVTVTYAGE